MNVKENDLAILIVAKFFPENIGRIVKVLKFIGGEQNKWLVEAQRPMRLMIEHNEGIPQEISFHLCHAPDSHLRPISGLLDDDSVDTTSIISKEVETTV
jgi:hypothetical protein